MSNEVKGKNDIAWERIFEDYDLLDEINRLGFVKIKNTTIGEYREVRHMTKFDFKENLPLIFKENDLSILPLSRSEFLISKSIIFHDTKHEKDSKDIIRLELPAHLESIEIEGITSEAIALNALFISGALKHFLSEPETMYHTISNRMSSGQFDFQILDNQNNQLVVSVNNSQIEIDGGYEGLESLAIVEAKNTTKRSAFNIRQLYYPYRCWKEKVTKPIRLIYMTHSNGLFNLTEYKFKDPNDYSSLVFVRNQHYSFDDDTITDTEIVNLFESITVENEPNINYPQANSFERVINICEIINEENSISRDEVTSHYDFDVRQTNYYTDAAIYLGLVKKTKSEKNEINYELTKLGKDIFKKKIKERKLLFSKQILKRKSFYETFKKYLMTFEIPGEEEIVKNIIDSKPKGIKSKVTLFRRASTVKSWINWIIDLIE